MVNKTNSTGRLQVQATDLLAMIHMALMMAGLYILIPEICRLKGADRVLYMGYAILILIPLAASFLLVRKLSSMALYLLAAAGETVLAAWSGAALMKAEAFYVPLSLAAVNTVCHALIWIIRLKSRLEQSQIRQDFEAVHEGETNVMLDAWEADSMLNSPSPWHWVWMALLYLPGVFASLSTYYHIMFVLMILDVFVMFGWHYLESFDSYVKAHHKVASMPIDMMRRVHRTVMAAAVLLLFLAILPAISYGKEPLDGYRLPVRESTVREEEIVEAENSVEPSTQDNWMEEIDGESHEMPKWVQTLLGLIMYGASGLILLWILKSMLEKVRELGRDFGHEEEDEVIFLDESAENQDQILYGGKKKGEGYFTPNAKIRRLYKKTIEKKTRDRVKEWKAPAELEEEAMLTGEEYRRKLHETYEKARYSREGCGKEDLDQLKK